MAKYRRRHAFQNSSLDYFQDVQIELSAVKEYINQTVSFLEKLNKKLERNKDLMKSATEQDISFFDYFDHEVAKKLKSQYYQSLFILMYSILEKKMKLFCEKANLNTEKIKKYSGIYKYFNTLKMNIGDLLFEETEVWDRINKYNALRNEIVHSSSNKIFRSNKYKNRIELIKSIDYLTLHEYSDHIYFEIDNIKLVQNFHHDIATLLYDIYFEKH